ncbi:MAG: AAA family ATPase [Acidobacteria bacterium]|nr:AAA family ATPase [Acidobacteriota bacterium]
MENEPEVGVRLAELAFDAIEEGRRRRHSFHDTLWGRQATTGTGAAATKAIKPAATLYSWSDAPSLLVILDEIQRTPQLFSSLRGLIDAGRRRGQGTGRFLVLDSASIDLLKQSSESLAGRIRHLELAPLDVAEVGTERLDTLWLRGGFPDSLLADSNAASLRWRVDFIRTYLERDLPQLGPPTPAETLRRPWTMLAHGQSGLGGDAREVDGSHHAGPSRSSSTGPDARGRPPGGWPSRSGVAPIQLHTPAPADSRSSQSIGSR